MKTNPLITLARGISEHVLRFIQMAGKFSEDAAARDRDLARYWVDVFTRNLATDEVPVSGLDTQNIVHALMIFSKSSRDSFLILLDAKVDAALNLREAPHIVAGIFDALADFSYAANYGVKISEETPLEPAKKVLAKMLALGYRDMDGKEKAALSGSIAACLKAWEDATQDPVSPGTSGAMLGTFYWLVKKAEEMSDPPADGPVKRLTRFGAAVVDEVAWKLFAKISPRARLKVLSGLMDEPSPKK